MRNFLLVAAFAVVVTACVKPPTPEELAEQTATDLDTFWQEAVATARITNTMQVRDEFFTTIEGLQRNPSSSRPVIPDSSVTNDAFADFRILTKRVFSQANVLESRGTMVKFRLSGNDLCTPLRGNFNVDTTCVKNADRLKLAIRAVAGSAGVDLTLLVNETIEVGTVQILKGVSVSVTVDLANARAASEFVNSTLGTDSPFSNLTFDGTGKAEVKLRKYGPSDFEATIGFLTDVSGTVTDNNGFTRSGKSAARNPALALRIEGPAKSVTASADIGVSEFRGLWSDFFDYKLKTPMVWSLSGFGFKVALKDGGARTLSGVSLGSGLNTLSYAGETVVSVTLNPNANNRFDVEFSTGASGLSAATVKPGISAAIAFKLQPVANAGSSIDATILNSTYSYDLSSTDQAPKIELARPTMSVDGSFRLTQGTIALSGSSHGSPRVFNAPTCMAFRQSSLSSSMNPFLDIWLKCEECMPGQCGSPPVCGPSNCFGCCFNNQCWQGGSSNTRCGGTSGSTCVDCTASSRTCNSNTRVCQ